MPRLGCLRLKKSTALALAVLHLVLMTLAPERVAADQPNLFRLARAIPDLATFVPSAQSSNELRYLLPDLSSLTNIYSRLSGVDALTAETAELFDALRQEYTTWEKTWLKAVAHETLSATVETGLYTAFFGGSLTTMGGVFVLTFVSSAMVYVGHEYVWNYFLPPDIFSTTPQRIATKAATYRALSMFKTFALGRILSGVSDASDSLTFTFSVMALDTILYGAIEYSFETIFVDQSDLTTLRAIVH